jgi:lysosomal Pro-X carboxypeptidase
MWERAAAFGAYIVFAEHRYYGQSWPLSSDPLTSQRHMQFLSSQQALADYAALLRSIKRGLGAGGEAVPAIAFGGSYGGVLSAMMRLKYPGAVAGAIAASAPLRAFPTQLPAWDTQAYYGRITADATSAGGSPDQCAQNIRSLWQPLFADAQTVEGRARLSTAFRTCSPLASADDGLALAFWVRGGFDGMSMGNYPYPSDYISYPATLPAFPVRVACSHLASTPPTVEELYSSIADAVGVLVNASGSLSCFPIDPNPYTHPAQQYDGIWDYQQCTEWQPDSQWFETRGGAEDMFWPQPYNASFLVEHCAAAWNVTVTELSKGWMATSFNLPSLSGGGSNIVFSMGSFDPWGSAGILTSPDPDRLLISLNITGGAHHLDLMFSDPADPPSVTQAREVEMQLVATWIAMARSAATRAEL